MSAKVFKFPDRDHCRRCGANEQATHHPFCQSRDGTPTPYSDKHVRSLIRHAGYSYPDELRSDSEVKARDIAAQKGYAINDGYGDADAILIFDPRTGDHAAISIDWSGALCFLLKLPALTNHDGAA